MFFSPGNKQKHIFGWKYKKIVHAAVCLAFTPSKREHFRLNGSPRFFLFFFTAQTWVQHHHINLNHWHLAVSWTSLLCDCKVSCLLAQCFSLWSCMSTECLISAGRDKCLVSMATIFTHVNMRAVCADKTWRYAFLSCGLVCHNHLWDLHKSRKCTCTVLLDFSRWTIGGSSHSPYDFKSEVLKSDSGVIFGNIFHGLSLLSKIFRQSSLINDSAGQD